MSVDVEHLQDRVAALERALYKAERPVRYVYEAALVRLLGCRPNVPRSRRERGKWVEGTHWIRVEGGILYDLEEIDRWHHEQGTQASATRPTARASRSDSSTAASRTRGRSTSRSLRLV